MTLFRALILILAVALGMSPALAQMQGGPLQNGTPLSPTVTGSDTTSGAYFGNNRVGVSGHLEGGVGTGDSPTATLCGAQPDAGSTDMAGTITNIGTTTCTISFGTAYTGAPSCVVLDYTGVRASMASSVSNTAIAVTGITAADRLGWLCVAKSGG